MTNNPSEIVFDIFTKKSKIVPFLMSLNAEFLEFSAKIIKSLVSNS